MSPYAVKGGIGDFLQCLPFMLSNPNETYLVASHYDQVTRFFGKLGLKVHEMPLGRLGGYELCPRQLFFDKNPFPRRIGSSRPLLGVHLGGSSYSLSVEKRFGFAEKCFVRHGNWRAGFIPRGFTTEQFWSLFWKRRF